MKINLDDYEYPLPEERIAQHPLRERDLSKLQVYREGRIGHHVFHELPGLLPEKSLLVFNETRVIPARINFRKPSGAFIEILLLHPVSPSVVMPVAMESKEQTSWECMVRNLRKWPDQMELSMTFGDEQSVTLRAAIEDRDRQVIRFSWEPPELTFSEVLEITGKTPLPPYMKREPESEDLDRYQTVYSRNQGAVAAPTAGLHFTDKTLQDLSDTGHQTDFITLHVSAGTFQPIREENIREHPMHKEQVLLTRRNILNWLRHPEGIIAVGTTSMRTLESAYWYGVKLLRVGPADFFVGKLYPYEHGLTELPPLQASLEAILACMDEQKTDSLLGETEIFIFPEYEFKVCRGLITNYHIPRSTLILLVAAFTGQDWKKIYREALDKDYRFLSYGDSSLLLP